MPTALMIFAHFSISLRSSYVNCSGVPPTNSLPTPKIFSGIRYLNHVDGMYLSSTGKSAIYVSRVCREAGGLRIYRWPPAGMAEDKNGAAWRDVANERFKQLQR